MINKKWVLPLLVVNTLALVDSLYLTWHHYQIEIAKPITKSFCTINSFIDCDSVALSSYARVLGLPAASLGVFAYLFLLGLYVYLIFYKKSEIKNDFQLSFIVLSVMFLFSMRQFIASLIFVKAVCIMCIGLYLCIVLMIVFNYLLLGGINFRDGINQLLDLLKMKNQKVSAAYLGLLGFSVIMASSVSFMIKSHFELAKDPVVKTSELEKTVLDFYKELPSQEIDYSGLPFKGAEDAPFVFLEVSDFECPYCSVRGAILLRLMEKFNGLIKIYFLNFPLDKKCNKTIKKDFHENACLAAQYAICASKMNSFWPYHDYLFENQKQINKEWLKKSINKFSFNEDEFRNCLESEGISKLNQDLERSYKLNVSYTPTIFLNGKKISDLVQREEDISSLLESIIKETLEK